jgi:anti-sigma B factor antagonist/stage II sporulation protein AA (anti-sigma F factor antagonist)
MDSLIEIMQEEKGEILIMRLSGRLDATSSPMLEKKITALIDGGKYKLLLNFDNIEYLSSAGMRLLLSTTKKLKSQDGKIVICSVVDNVMEVIKMAGFDHILHIKDTETEALEEF